MLHEVRAEVTLLVFTLSGEYDDIIEIANDHFKQHCDKVRLLGVKKVSGNSLCTGLCSEKSWGENQEK